MTVSRDRIGVLDKSVAVLEAVAGGARTVGEVVGRTGLSRATAHRLATRRLKRAGDMLREPQRTSTPRSGAIFRGELVIPITYNIARRMQ